jgi:hypothetical protein
MRAASYKKNAYLAVLPQPLIMHELVAQEMEQLALRLFQHYPHENSLARREFAVPFMIGRFDAIIDQAGQVQICELDDVCSLWPALPQINPIASSYLTALEDQLGMPIYTAELFEYADGAHSASPLVRQNFAQISFIDDNGAEKVAYVPRTSSFMMAIQGHNGLHWRPSRKTEDLPTHYFEKKLQRFYAHNEDHWRGDITDAWLFRNEKRDLDHVALSIRAYRDMKGFDEHLDRFGPRSISMAWHRDEKWPLVPEGLASLAANLDVALEFGRRWETAHPGELLVLKTLHGARTEGTAVYSNKGTKPRGASSERQVRRKFGEAAASPVLVQPYKEPDRLSTAGIAFRGSADAKTIRSVSHIGSTQPAQRVLHGFEDRFAMIFRTFVIYLPKDKRLVHIGGLWQATDGRIVHGGSHSVAGPLYVDGLQPHAGTQPSQTLDQATALLRQYGRLKAPQLSQ